MTDFGQLKWWGERLAKPASLPTYNKFFIVIPNLPAAGRQSEESLLITTLFRSG